MQTQNIQKLNINIRNKFHVNIIFENKNFTIFKVHYYNK